MRTAVRGTSLRRQLARTFGTTIALTLIAIGLFGSLLAYGIQARATSAACADSLRLIGDILPLYPTPQFEPRAKVDVIMTHLHHPGLIVVADYERIRYEARWRPANPDQTAGYIVMAEPRTGLPSSYDGASFPGRLAFSLATLAGYQGSWAQFGDTEIGIIADPRSLVAMATRTFAGFLVIVVLSLVIGYLLGNAMAREALRPLAAVVEALEAFAAGNLTPQPIVPDRSEELGRLASAYNGAIETVGRAFAERSSAEAQMRQFISDAGHQLRTPLTVLRGFIEILKKGALRKPEDLTRIVETMAQQGAVMTSLIDKLLLLEQWAEETAPDAVPRDVGAAVEHIVAPIADSHPERDIRLCAVRGAMAAIDHDELSHVVSNLVTNALKYAPQGTISVEVTASDDEVLIAVSDQGYGMTPEELEHAFDRFYRGPRRSVPGSGLGLAIAKRAVERAKGTLAARSEPGRGACFSISLPRVAASGNAEHRQLGEN